MSDFRIHYLGCGSATPTVRHLPSCQVVEFRGRLMMIDCGEGAQLQFRRQRLKFSRLNHIFISHLHGDHFLGLPGLLSTLALHGVGGTVTVHTFAEGADILQRILAVFCRELGYELKFNIIEPKRAVIYSDKSMTVETFPLKHRVPAVGFLFREHPGERHIIGDMARFLEIPLSQLPAIKAGADFVRPDGSVVPNERITTPPSPAMSYAYCSDTVFNPAIADDIRGVNTLYHEATYLDDSAYKAAARGHSTASQAGRLATLAGAKRLVLGHYSQAYDSDELFAEEASTTFDGEVIAAHEGLTIDLK
ncbi:MAG: ribonuclease Z [Muribaculaceae bacterium]|nr:ribonuclease Z [Muribaculaceae bacterium]